MPRIKQGLIHTGENCIGCNRCISVCPIPSANISVIVDGALRVEVDDRTCIRCGRCVVACQHGARTYTDDTDQFFADLNDGEKIDLVISPTFFALYPEDAGRILGFLKARGVEHFYDAHLGTVIATWCYLDLLDKQEPALLAGEEPIAHVCPAATRYMERQVPDHLKRLAPIQTPLSCMAIYLREYLHVNTKFAVLSPCIAQKEDTDSSNATSGFSYNLTFKHLMERIDLATLGQETASVEPLSLDYSPIIPAPNKIKDTLEWFLPPESMILGLTGLSASVTFLPLAMNDLRERDVVPVLADLYSCDLGCIAGPGAQSPRRNCALELIGYRNVRQNVENGLAGMAASRQERRRKLDELFAGLDPQVFRCSYEEHFRQPAVIPQSVIDEIFQSMHKLTPASQKIDCGGCGHTTCRAMAEAIANGYDRRENCNYYTKDETIRRFRKDPLTGIDNEAAFHISTRALLDAHPDTPYLLAVMDVKDFKVINDLLGFDEGSRTLRYIASKLTELVGDQGTCARLHSDHFAFCMPEEPDTVANVIETSQHDCDEFDLDFPLTVKFGFYRTTDRDVTVDRMVDLALIAESIAKGNVLKRYAFYSSEMRDKVIKEATIAARMHEAPADKQFHVYFQPQYNHATSSLVGAEALVRWIDPEKGMISPGDFIPVFEKNGFITQLDHFVWEQTCVQLREWMDEGVEVVPVSVNLSRLDIYDPALVGTLTHLIEEYRIPQELLKLEITESAYVESPKQLIATVGELQKLGFTIEMDDFGSGYSSLNTLKDVPVDILKIDLAFLAGDNAARGGNILQSVIRMARWLGLPVIAEGVENIQQADYLKSIGCQIVQGYYYSPPIPSDHFESLLRETRKSKASDAGSMEATFDLDELWNHESQIAWFFDHILDSAMIFEYHDGSLECLRVNDAFYDTTGLTQGQFLLQPKNLMATVVPEDRDALMESLDRAVDTGKIVIARAHWNFSVSKETVSAAAAGMSAEAIAAIAAERGVSVEAVAAAATAAQAAAQAALAASAMADAGLAADAGAAGAGADAAGAAGAWEPIELQLRTRVIAKSPERYVLCATVEKP